MLCAFQVEIIIRELDGVLYQALHLAKEGNPSLVGDGMVYRYIRKNTNPILLFDSDQHAPTNRHVLSHGGIVINLNSEGQGFVDNPPEMQNNFAQVINSVSKICVWGQKQKGILSPLVPEDRAKDILVTGHPSFDLLSPSFTPYYRNENIEREFGDDYILINTSFGMFNHEMGFDYYVKMLSKMEEWKIYGDSHHLERLKHRCSHEEKHAMAMTDLARKIAKSYPERHVVIRPHPAEGSTFYAEKTRDLNNVHIRKEGSVREWIASCGTLIHHDCTTGMEGLLMGKQVLQFAPYSEASSTANLMTSIGQRVTSAEQVLSLVVTKKMGEKARKELKQKIAPYLENISGNAAHTIAELVATYDDRESWLPEPLGAVEKFKRWRKYASKLIRSKQPGRNGRKVRYALNKFSRIPHRDITARIQRLRQCEPTLPEVEVKQLCLNTFLITPKN